MSEEEIQEPAEASEETEAAEEQVAPAPVAKKEAGGKAPLEAVDEEAKSEAYQIGVLVFVILIVLTIGEFLFAIVAPPWWWALALIAFLKAAYVIRDYMHVSRAFNPDQEDH